MNAQNNTATTTTEAIDTYYAQPYSCDHTGFYFTDLQEFTQKAAASGAEEFELQYIDGEEGQLWNAAGVNQSNLQDWFNMLEELEAHQYPALFYVCDHVGMDISEAMEQVSGGYTFEDYSVQPGTALSYAEQYIDDTGALEALPESLQYYFDYEAFARDMVLNGDVSEFTYDGDAYTATGG